VDYLSFATEVELGYDPTITRVIQGTEEYHLRIQVKSRTFITRKVLVDFAADSLLGRGTRVWRGHFEDEYDKVCVLKDMWVDTDRPTEGDILRDLASAFELNPYPNTVFNDYFLTVIDDFVIQLDGIHPDDTWNTMMNGQEPPKDCKILKMPVSNDLPSKVKTRSISHIVSSGMGPSPHEVKRAPNPHHFRPRSHYRITFKEVGKALYEEKSLHAIFKALKDVVTGSSDAFFSFQHLTSFFLSSDPDIISLGLRSP
jgi:hypothetical protein